MSCAAHNRGRASVANNLVNNEHQPKRCMIRVPELDPFLVLMLVFVRKAEAEKEQKLAFRGKRIHLCSASQERGGLVVGLGQGKPGASTQEGFLSFLCRLISGIN
jgi:hypothetical protein